MTSAARPAGVEGTLPLVGWTPDMIEARARARRPLTVRNSGSLAATVWRLDDPLEPTPPRQGPR